MVYHAHHREVLERGREVDDLGVHHRNSVEAPQVHAIGEPNHLDGEAFDQGSVFMVRDVVEVENQRLNIEALADVGVRHGAADAVGIRVAADRDDVPFPGVLLEDRAETGARRERFRLWSWVRFHSP